MTASATLTRRAALALTGAALCAPATLASESAVRTLSGAAFGTVWRVTAPTGRDLEPLRPALTALFDRIDRQMSPWRRDSALSRFNAAPAGSHDAPAALCHVTQGALTIARLSDGAFDPTVGPLVARWGFGPITKGGLPDWHALTAAPDRLSKIRDDNTLDLCGIAKGWALDQAVALLRDAGHRSALVDLGGELRALGRHPSGRPWHIAVAPPPTAAPLFLRLPPGHAIATSGLSAQSYTLGAQRYGHIVDPRRRTPADPALHSVSVLAPEAMPADAWATALFAAGPGKGPILARKQGLSALFLGPTGAGDDQIATGAVPGLLL